MGVAPAFYSGRNLRLGAERFPLESSPNLAGRFCGYSDRAGRVPRPGWITQQAVNKTLRLDGALTMLKRRLAVLNITNGTATESTSQGVALKLSGALTLNLSSASLYSQTRA